MKDYIVLLTCLTALGGSALIAIVSLKAVITSSANEASARCGYEAAMGELNRRDQKHLKLGFVK